MGLRGALEEFVDQSLIGLGLLGGEAAKLGEEREDPGVRSGSGWRREEGSRRREISSSQKK
jgi:hypothetical protein